MPQVRSVPEVRIFFHSVPQLSAIEWDLKSFEYFVLLLKEILLFFIFQALVLDNSLH